VSRELTSRQKAARVLLAGGTEAKAAEAAGKCKRQIQRWKKEADFMALLHPGARVTLGHLPEPAGVVCSTDPLGSLQPSRAWVSVSDRSVLGQRDEQP